MTVFKKLLSINTFFVIIAALITIPSFYRMLRPGIYSMQDFQLFRLFEFDKCVKDFQIPCRWTPDAGLGYGEPVFNFYGQVPFVIGEAFHFLGFNIINSFKLVFISSLAGSALTMFFLAKKLWKNNFAALISSAVYVYAPYRALDVWVRGVPNESLGFVIFPLLFLSLENYIEKERVSSLISFSLLLSLLVLTHNLSVILFLPVLVIWTFYRLFTKKKWKLLVGISGGILLTFLVSSFYLLPVIFEAKYVDIQSTISGYFDFRGHFAALYQLLISRFWGYGGSVFGPEDGLSLSVGHLQWILPMIVLVTILIKKKFGEYKDVIIFVLLGWFLLLLTHNKSTFFWEITPAMAYIQFPWRFLGPATFSFALASGVVANLYKNQKLFLSVVIISAAILLNFSFFKEDIWYKVTDSYFTGGEEWNRQRAASIGDFWPKFGGVIPASPASENPQDGRLITKKTNLFSYNLNTKDKKEVELPVNYFPGWQAKVNGKDYKIYPGKTGLITLIFPGGEGRVDLIFKDTPIRILGNIISLIGVLTILFLGIRYRHEA